MGLTTAGRIAARLIAEGRSASTPAAIVERASLPDQRRLLTRLGDLEAACSPLDGPALLIIGEVAALADVSPQVLSVALSGDSALDRRDMKA